MQLSHNIRHNPSRMAIPHIVQIRYSATPSISFYSAASPESIPSSREAIPGVVPSSDSKGLSADCSAVVRLSAWVASTDSIVASGLAVVVSSSVAVCAGVVSSGAFVVVSAGVVSSGAFVVVSSCVVPSGALVVVSSCVVPSGALVVVSAGVVSSGAVVVVPPVSFPRRRTGWTAPSYRQGFPVWCFRWEPPSSQPSTLKRRSLRTRK